MTAITEEWGSHSNNTGLLSLVTESGKALQSAIVGAAGIQDSLPTFRSQRSGLSQVPGNLVRATLSLTQPAKTLDFGDSVAVFDLDGLRRTPFQAYSARIDSLRDFALQDGFSLNPESEADFWRFVQTAPDFRKGNLVLIDNGNLRAVWKNDEGDHLGLQFLGGGMLQYVVFKRRSANSRISQVTGRDTFVGLIRQINAFDLESLLGK
ncbi:MAG: hypothetical protein F4Y22_11925 [Gammaproteobacteria bacterium]|nr:hypothetical protein [Gammaproteobacteria bacterium]MYH47205.1 hypothetical protein [Gammaproteobacteria bacterium]MYL13069.1 hypothetical protein [Gammaproteobacteria bacterium]